MERINHLNCRRLGNAISLTPWVANTSAARAYMFAGHLGQMLVIAQPSVRKNLTGAEREYGKYVFNTRFKHDCRVIRKIPKFGYSTGDVNSIAHSPQRTILTERASTGVLDVLIDNDWVKKHQQFGYFLRPTNQTGRVEPKEVFRAGDVIAQSPNVTPHGDWCYGKEVNVAFLSIPQVIEDGMVIAKSLTREMAYTVIDEKDGSCGGKWIPLNLYGDAENYKPFPDVGEKIAEHGVIFALRRYDPDMAFVDFTPEALMEIEYQFDRVFRGEPGATVIDVDVFWGGRNRQGVDRLPAGMETQFMKYHKKHMDYFRTLLEEYHHAKAKYRDNLVVSPMLEQLLVRAMARTDLKEYNNPRLGYTFKRKSIDDWRVVVKYAYTAYPTIGNKGTGTSGDKGVIVDLWDDEDMPVDDWGVRAQLITDPDSTIKRMNPGRTYEQYVNKTDHHVRLDVLRIYAESGVEAAWEHLFKYYQLVAPEFAEEIEAYLEHVAKQGVARARGATGGATAAIYEAKRYHLEAIKAGPIIKLLPPNSRIIGAEQIRRIMYSEFRPPESPITYRGRSGKIRRTKNNVIIGSIYFLLLEKTGDDWSAVSSTRLQHFNLPAKLSRDDKMASPGRDSPVRFAGEDEIRLIAAWCGSLAAAELLDRSNSPMAQRFISRNILRAKTPGRIANVVPRDKVPLGLNAATLFIKHMLSCSGVSFASTGVNGNV